MTDRALCNKGCGFYASQGGFCSQCFKAQEKECQARLNTLRAQKEDLETRLAVYESMEASGGLLPEDEQEMATARVMLEGVEDALAGAAAALDALRAPPATADAVPDDIAAALEKSMEEDTKHPCRRLSLADDMVAEQIRDLMSSLKAVSESGIAYVKDTSHDLFEIPALLPQYSDLVTNQLADGYIQDQAERDGTLAWRRTETGSARLVVLQTLGDGNCLCHGASLLLWRVHDRRQVLRRCIKETLHAPPDSPMMVELRQRFDCERARIDGAMGFRLDADQLAVEWRRQQEVVDAAFDARQGAGYLSELHAFVLANVLRRPIVLFGNDEAHAAGMSGVFLPLLWKDPAQCSRSPILLLFRDRHFSALAVARRSNDGQPEHMTLETKASRLPVRFLLESESEEAVIARWAVSSSTTAAPAGGGGGVPVFSVGLRDAAAATGGHLQQLSSTLEEGFFSVMCAVALEKGIDVGTLP